MMVAEEAARIMMEGLAAERRIDFKGRGNVVTDVDLAVERRALDMLRSEFPDHAILSEETRASATPAEFTWIVDPIDGTRNYASGIPHFCTTLALAHGDEVVLGVTHDPARREVFWAERDRGAFLNPSTGSGRRSGQGGSPIRASDRPSLQESVVGFDMGYDDEWGRRNLEVMLSLWPGMQTIRVMGSVALGLAYVAAGRLDIYFHRNIYPWDIAAGIRLVEEAGGLITDADGGPVTYHSPSCLAAGPSVHADFLKLTEGHPWRL
jgi:myo-inositol-1(or 4)-monophosphatase